MVSKMAKNIKTSHSNKDHPIYTRWWAFTPSDSGFKRPKKRKKPESRKVGAAYKEVPAQMRRLQRFKREFRQLKNQGFNNSVRQGMDHRFNPSCL